MCSSSEGVRSSRRRGFGMVRVRGARNEAEEAVVAISEKDGRDATASAAKRLGSSM